MRSSTGAYYVGLDHLRALAALEVFTWHFLHYPKYNELRVAPIPWGFLAEGHIGVSLFMTLSGYIFAKLLSDRDIIYPRFVFNRCVRLLPLLLFVITVVAMKTLWQRGDWSLLSRNIMWGWLRPNLPNGGWSITVEFHFYLILPWLLWSMRRWKRWLWLTLLGAIGVRLALWLYLGSVQRLAFWTIAGRFDQFLLGIYTFELRHTFVKHRWLGAVAVIAYLGYFTWFDAIGGYHSTTKHPLLGSIWIVEPTIEAVLSALLIGSYDQLPVNETSRFFEGPGKDRHLLVFHLSAPLLRRG